MELQKIAFLETFAMAENGGIMGGILVTDADTKPIEFRSNCPYKTYKFSKNSLWRCFTRAYTG